MYLDGWAGNIVDTTYFADESPEVPMTAVSLLACSSDPPPKPTSACGSSASGEGYGPGDKVWFEWAVAILGALVLILLVVTIDNNIKLNTLIRRARRQQS
jgi:hypothetical protein